MCFSFALGFFAIILAITLVIGVLGEWMVQSESANIFEQTDADAAAESVALVLGAGPGTQYFDYRLDAAVQTISRRQGEAFSRFG